MSNCGCSPSGYPTANNECCTDIPEYTRLAYSSAQSAFANAQNAEQSAEDAATTLANAVLKTGSTMTGLLVLSGNPVVALGAATKQYVDANDAIIDGAKVNRVGDTMTGGLVINVNSPNTALRVTQVGAGNSFEVEDSTNPDITPFKIDAAGNVSIGTNLITEKLTIVGGIQATGNIRTSGPTSGVGYSTGAGGAGPVYGTGTGQTITINNTCGSITCVSAAGNTTIKTVTVTNSTVAETDVVIVCGSGGANSYETAVYKISAGAFTFNYLSPNGTAIEAPVFNFAVIKSVTT